MMNSSPVVINEFVTQLKPNFFGLKVDNTPIINILPGATA